MSRLAPLSEVPTNEEESDSSSSKKAQTWRNWLRTHMSLLFITKKSDLRILLSVLGCPLFPVSFHPKIPITQVSSSAEYIIEHFRAASGCRKIEGAMKNMYVTGKVAMGIVDEPSSAIQKGCFVLWQMVPNKWLIELVVGAHKVVAGSDGNVAWRHTPWLASHAAKGPIRPLRRALQATQVLLGHNRHSTRVTLSTSSLNVIWPFGFDLKGLDPLAVSAVFSAAEYVGEKKILGIDSFVLKLSANHPDLTERSDNTAEMIKHVVFGYFSQRSGLLVYVEDSYLTRIQSPGSPPTYWETTMGTKVEDYRPVEGVMIAHSGCSSVIITRFGDNLKAGPAITRMEETYIIDDVAFNVPGLSIDSFIPPEGLNKEDNLDSRSPLQ
ncbi:hypothetical protein RND71_036843 [Anisodus tanguticus]|uniref:Uncharacterized protein n=1 Tax=Anisodus tanguticus TaxID=243964 RepID=A0AAE1V079_9SOLA|nr:hypothetical protein RND71_036843 [Anisodus tanguticus]